MIRSPAFSGRSYAVLGLARSGMATVATLVASGARVLAWDTRDEARDTVTTQFGAAVTLADPLTADLRGFDGIVVSPGVPLNRHPIAGVARAAGVPLVGDIELFAQARASLPPHRVVAITGTNGKSTTTALVDHLCRAAGLPARMGGNIGLPILAQEPLQPNAAGNGVYVLELSSFQIDLTRSLAVEIAALVNISPDHLDRYDSFDAYAASKARLFAMQDEQGEAVFAPDDPHSRRVADKLLQARGGTRVHLVDPNRLAGQDAWPSLQGPHNLQNAAIAVKIADLLGIAEAQWRPALASFGGLPHRMERVSELGGVLFVNDSKATNPASAAPALAAFPRIHWIVGGLPKGDDLGECAAHFGNVAAAYTIGEAEPRFAELLEPVMPVRRCGVLAEAVRAAAAVARPGEVVMLSPACASFDQFRDFEARGEAFRAVVEALAAEARPVASSAGGGRR